jgi:signal transduction histidine kinase
MANSTINNLQWKTLCGFFMAIDKCINVLDVANVLVNSPNKLGFTTARFHQRVESSDPKSSFYELVTWTNRSNCSDLYNYVFLKLEDCINLRTTFSPQWGTYVKNNNNLNFIDCIEKQRLINKEWCDIPLRISLEKDVEGVGNYENDIFGIWSLDRDIKTTKPSRSLLTEYLTVIANYASCKISNLYNGKIFKTRKYLCDMLTNEINIEDNFDNVMNYVSNIINAASFTLFTLQPEKMLLKKSFSKIQRINICKYCQIETQEVIDDFDEQYYIGEEYLTCNAWDNSNFRKHPVNIRKYANEKSVKINNESLSYYTKAMNHLPTTAIYIKLKEHSFIPGMFRIINRIDNPDLQFTNIDNVVFRRISRIISRALEVQQARKQNGLLLRTIEDIVSPKQTENVLINKISKVGALWGIEHLGIYYFDDDEIYLNDNLSSRINFNYYSIDWNSDVLIEKLLNKKNLQKSWIDLAKFTRSKFSKILTNNGIHYILAITIKQSKVKGFVFCVGLLNHKNIDLDQVRENWNEYLQIDTIMKALSSIIANYFESTAKRLSVERAQELLVDVGHEFRSPAQNIIQVAQRAIAIAETLSKNNNYRSEVLKLDNMIYKQALTIRKILDNTICIGQTMSSTVQYDMEPGKLSKSIEYCTELLEYDRATRNAKFEIYESVYKLPACNYDKIQIGRVLFNLLENALKYSHTRYKNNRIKIKIYGERQQNINIIHIENWGQGILSGEKRKIFDHFFRSTKQDERRIIGGFGVGLSICKRIAEAHDGDIYIESKYTLDDPIRARKGEGYLTIVSLRLSRNLPQGQKVIVQESYDV